MSRRSKMDPYKLSKQSKAAIKDLSNEQMEAFYDKLPELREAFKMFDRNKDGTISPEELSDVMCILGNNPTPDDVEKIMCDLDTNHNGKIEYEEFVVLMAKHLKDPVNVEQELRDAFAVFDRDGNHFIDANEIRYVMKNIGEKLTDAQVDEIFKRADLNGDGKLDYDEFVRLMTEKPTAS